MSRFILNKLHTLLGNEWAELLAEEFNKPYMRDLGMIVADDRKSHTIYPETPAEVFSVFKNLQPSKIKVLILGQDPYHDGSYDGRAFSNSIKDTLKLSPSLRNILKEVENDIFDDFMVNYDGDLSRWEKQGVFLMNRVLTVRKGLPNSHANIGWERFTSKIISLISNDFDNVVFMLWGAKARSAKKLIDLNKHFVLESAHPSPMSANQGGWFGNKHFSSANKYLVEHKKDKINW